jgi:transcription elongation factor Elf1
MAAEIDCAFRDFAVCPWCDHEEHDSWELDDGENCCNSCGQAFNLRIDTTITYTTQKIERDG